MSIAAFRQARAAQPNPADDVVDAWVDCPFSGGSSSDLCSLNSSLTSS